MTSWVANIEQDLGPGRLKKVVGDCEVKRGVMG
jgi:hypothetical protein